MPKLTDTQLIILGNAAQRDDHGVAEISDRKAVAGLLKTKLLTTVPLADGLALWERQEDGTPLALAITAAGLDAIGVEEPPVAQPVDGAKRGARKAKAAKGGPKLKVSAVHGEAAAKAPTNKPAPTGKASRTGSKIDTVIAMLRRAKGATIEDLMKATDWQAHSVRGAISGALKSKRGLTVTSEMAGTKRIYRIPG